ncbi:MAG: aspartate-semialdehyde dehydrogenase, partial [Candidatus Margulisbacteria bacterium]|nr:aspartate-semialdehyde dehydrogenase [Candidatus Margulisiibacteriota bacterium]
MSKYVVAVVGATGVVGTEIIKVLQERKLPVKTLVPLASKRSLGTSVEFNGKDIDVEVLSDTSFKGVDFALFSAGGSISKEYVPIAVRSGAIAIDNTSYFRMDPDVPLIVPEINAKEIGDHKIIANPNCSTAQMVLALKPIHDKVGIERVVISTYQSVSGAGKNAMDELENQSRTNLKGGRHDPKYFPHHIAFNVIPHIGPFLENGYTEEEMKLINETRKILGDDTIRISATAVRVPVFVGHSESVNIQTKKKISVEEVRKLLDKMPGVTVKDNVAQNES